MNRLLIASLDRFGPLREGVRERLAACAVSAETFQAGDLIFAAGARSQLRLLARGLAIKEMALPDGARQIYGIATPGDLIDLGGLFTGIDHDMRALGPCEVRKVTPRELKSMLQDHASLLGALCRATLTEARTQRNWMVSLGRRSAVARTANLLCEIYWRQRSLALAKEGECAFPAVQVDIADALGLSVVHIHRVLRALREDGLASLRNGVLRIQDWDRLTAVAGFDPELLRPQRDQEDPPPPFSDKGVGRRGQ